MEKDNVLINGIEFTITGEPAKVGEIDLGTWEPFAIPAQIASAINGESYESALAKFHSGEYKVTLPEPTLWERIVSYFK